MEIVTAGKIDWFVLKRKAIAFAHEQKLLLKDPHIDPAQIEADINWKVAVNDVRYNLSFEQREELLQLVMDESGMTAHKEHQLALAKRQVNGC